MCIKRTVHPHTYATYCHPRVGAPPALSAEGTVEGRPPKTAVAHSDMRSMSHNHCILEDG
jgi:hypothetical protein